MASKSKKAKRIPEANVEPSTPHAEPPVVAETPSALTSDGQPATASSETTAGENRPAMPSRAGKKRGGTKRCREVVIHHPAWKTDEVLATLTSEGFKVSRSTVEVTRYECLATLAVLGEMGLIDVKPLPASDDHGGATMG